jgi:hypothetical protein
MHKSLTPGFNVILIIIITGVLAIALVLSWRHALMLIYVTVPLGIAAGVAQVRALAANPEGFRSSKTAIEVRRALLSTASGKLSVVLLWGTGVFALIWAIAVNPSNPIIVWLAGQASFSLARECCSLPSLLRLAAQA